MDHTQYIRDPQRLKSVLRQLPDKRLVTTQPVKIVIPARFAERDLAHIGIETQIVGIFAIILEDKYYSVSLANAMMPITPTSMTKVKYDDDEYYEFSFDAGATILPSTLLVQQDTLVFSINNEIIAKGRVPWYLNYDDLGKLFDSSKYHANANVGQQQEITELMVSLISRAKDDRQLFYRQVVQSYDELVTKPPVFIPLRSVAYNASNTLNKLAGSYARDGLVSALVTPTTRVEKIEELLRS